MSDPLFAPPHGEWRRPVSGYITARRITTLITWLIVFGVPVGALTAFAPWPFAVSVGAAGLIVLVWRVIRVAALCRAHGYAEMDEELYLTKGIWFQSLTVVPYGRMQVVEVERDLFERWFGIATVRLVTASSDTDANIPGLTPDDALSLRDRLADRSDPYTSGL